MRPRLLWKTMQRFLGYQQHFCFQGSKFTCAPHQLPADWGRLFSRACMPLTNLQSLLQLLAVRRYSWGSERSTLHGAMSRGHVGLSAGCDEYNSSHRHPAMHQYVIIICQVRSSKMHPVRPPWSGGTWKWWPNGSMEDGAMVSLLL